MSLFPPLLSQVNRFNKSTDRGLLITDKYVYKLEPKKQYKVLKRFPLDAVSTHTGDIRTLSHTVTQRSSEAEAFLSHPGYENTHSVQPMLLYLGTT